MRSPTLLTAALLITLGADPSHAVDKCKVKVDKKTGVIRVDATGVKGPLGWGGAPGQAGTPFFNAATCVVGGKAKKCELADPATIGAKTPPHGCTLFVDDGVAECSVWISGCTPTLVAAVAENAFSALNAVNATNAENATNAANAANADMLDGIDSNELVRGGGTRTSFHLDHGESIFRDPVGFLGCQTNGTYLLTFQSTDIDQALWIHDGATVTRTNIGPSTTNTIIHFNGASGNRHVVIRLTGGGSTIQWDMMMSGDGATDTCSISLIEDVSPLAQ